MRKGKKLGVQADKERLSTLISKWAGMDIICSADVYPKTFLAKAMPSMRATGVRLTLSVTSPTA